PVEHLVDRYQGPVEALDGFTVIGTVAIVFGEGDRVRHLVRSAIEGRRAAEFRNQLYEACMECCDCRRPEIERCLTTVAAGADDLVLAKVEQDLDTGSVGYGRGCQAVRRDIKGRVPRMVEPRRVRQPVLACDLQVEVQG